MLLRLSMPGLQGLQVASVTLSDAHVSLLAPLDSSQDPPGTVVRRSTGSATTGAAIPRWAVLTILIAAIVIGLTVIGAHHLVWRPRGAQSLTMWPLGPEERAHSCWSHAVQSSLLNHAHNSSAHPTLLRLALYSDSRRRLTGCIVARATHAFL